MARRIEFEVVVDSDGAVAALKQIGDTAEEAGDDLQEMGEEGQQSARKASVSMAGLRGALGAVGTAAAAAAAAVAAVGAAVVQMAASNDQIAKMAAVLGTTAEELQVVTGALGLGGVSAGQAEQAIRDLNRRLGEAATRGGPAAEALERLGLSAQELERLPLVERFALIADRLGDVETQSLRTLTAQDLLGRSGVQLLAAFEGGGEGIRAAAGAIERAGIVSNEAAAESEALTDQVTLLKASLGRLMADALEPLVGPMTTFIEQINDSIHAYRRLQGLIPQVVTEQGRQVAAIEELSQELAEAESHLRGYSEAQRVLSSTPGLEEEAERNQEALIGMAERVADLTRRLHEARGEFREMADATEEATEAAQEMAEATTEETAAAADLNEALKETIKLKIDLTEKTEDLTQKSEEEAAAIVAAADAQREAADKRDQTLAEMVTRQREAYQEILGAALSVVDRISQAERDAMAERIEEERTASDRVQRIREQLAQATTERTRERLRAELDASIESERAAQRAALEAFERSKSLAFAQATISTAAAVAAALAQPPGPPVTIPAAIAAGALGAAQIAAIASEPAPAFHAGGLLRDEMMIRAREGEAVLSPSAVRAVGGEEGVRALNQGQGAAPTTIVVEQKIRTRVLDVQAYDLGRSGRGSLQSQILRGQPRPGSHRPTGMG